jgi:hypothetical protein
MDTRTTRNWNTGQTEWSTVLDDVQHVTQFVRVFLEMVPRARLFLGLIGDVHIDLFPTYPARRRDS